MQRTLQHSGSKSGQSNPFEQTFDYKFTQDLNKSPQPEKLDQISHSTSNEVIHTAKRTEKNESVGGLSRDLNPNIQVV